MSLKYLALLSLPLFAGCAGANITATMRQTPPPEGNLQTRCAAIDMRSDSAMEALFKKYDGWQVLYISEYTTKHRFGTNGVVCFERGTKG